MSMLTFHLPTPCVHVAYDMTVILMALFFSMMEFLKRSVYYFYGFGGSLLLHAGFLSLQQSEVPLHSGVQGSCRGFSCDGTHTLGEWTSVVVARGL